MSMAVPMIFQMKNKIVQVQDWGLVDYQEAWKRQEFLLASTVKLKTENRANSTEYPTPNYLVFVEHPKVYTIGKSGNLDNLLLDDENLRQQDTSFYKINRGGDITFHGPGQLVGYPILDLDNFFTDIHLYLRTLEEAIILTIKEYGIKAGRYPGFTGVWLDSDNSAARKICAMGVRCSRWVTMHGFALNLNNDLSPFNHIIPCGINDKSVTSLALELGKEIDAEEVKKILRRHISVLFNMELIEVPETPIP
jgi:lipoyl(octanoyl) transferase